MGVRVASISRSDLHNSYFLSGVLTDLSGLLLDLSEESLQAGLDSVNVLAFLDAGVDSDGAGDAGGKEAAKGENSEECGLHFEDWSEWIR